MALEEIARLRHSSVGILWLLYALHLQNKGVYYGAFETILGIRRRPKVALLELYTEGYIVNLSPRPSRGKITLTPKGIHLMREVCSIH